MSMSQKFLFDTSFEMEDLDGAAMPGRKPRAPKFSEEDLEKARVEGFAAGTDRGQRDAMQTIEQQASQALSAIAGQLTGLSQAQAQANERRTREALETALTIVRRLFPRLADRHGLAEIEAVVGDCLARLRDEPRIVIRVADSLLDRVEECVSRLVEQAGFEGKIVFLSQEGLNPGDVRVEWADGGAERNADQQWRDIDQLIARAIGPSQQPAEAAAPAPDPPANDQATPEPARAASAPDAPAPDGAVASA
jgi:flagellar assembly protein FliH